MALKSITQSHIFDAGNKPPRIRRYRDGLRVRTGKLTWLKTEKWVDPRGNVIPLALTTAAAASVKRCHQEAEDRRYVMRQAGGIPYGQCPLRTGEIDESVFPEELREVCQLKDEHGRRLFGEHKACAHVEHVIQKLQGEERAAWQERMRRRRAAAEREAERHKETQDTIAAAISRLGELAAGGGGQDEIARLKDRIAELEAGDADGAAGAEKASGQTEIETGQEGHKPADQSGGGNGRKKRR